MYSITKPDINMPNQKTNKIGLSLRDYSGAPSTLCGGCGHDSITSAIIQACYELSLPPEKVAKMSGIGCSSKTPGYFLSTAHGFNSVHGRMPSVCTGAYLAHGGLHYLAVSGDGDTGSIGIGQFIHAARRQLNMTYMIENNGVYGLTKGQFSALADTHSQSKSGEKNSWEPVDVISMAIQLNAGFVARAFSGDKDQLIPIIKAAIEFKGFALIDILSPCVNFNNHSGSTRSYSYIRDHMDEVFHISDFVPNRDPIKTSYPEGSTIELKLHDESSIKLTKKADTYDLNDSTQAIEYLNRCKLKKEIPTGILFINPAAKDFHSLNESDDRPLRDLALDQLSLNDDELKAINQEFR